MAAHVFAASPLACTLLHPLKQRASNKVLLKRCATHTLKLCTKRSPICVVNAVAGAACSPLGGGPAEDAMMRAERVEQLRAIRREGGRAAANVSKKEDESFMEVQFRKQTLPSIK
jgi:hypothetical protein